MTIWRKEDGDALAGLLVRGRNTPRMSLRPPRRCRGRRSPPPAIPLR